MQGRLRYVISRSWSETCLLNRLESETLVLSKTRKSKLSTMQLKKQKEVQKHLDLVFKRIKEEKNKNSIFLYTIVDNKLAQFLATECSKRNIPCFGVLGDLILTFSKLLNQEASHIPSGQHAMNDDYYKKIEAIQFTMNHDDGNSIEDIAKSDIILLGVSRTSKTPTSIYLANKGMKISNIPLINEQSVPDFLREKPNCTCIVGLTAEPDRLVDLRKNRMQSIKENENKNYVNFEKIRSEIEASKKLFQKYNWPTIDVTRKSVEETAASILKIHDIFNQND